MAAGEAASPVATREVRRRFDAVDAVTVVALGALSLWVVAVAVLRARSLGLVWTGTDGIYLGDQMQYLGWVSDAADNGRIGNWYQLDPRTERFVHPGLVVSGLLHRVGLSTALAYLVWKPVAVVVLFLACRAYVDRLVNPLWARRVALALALFALPGLGLGDWTARLASEAPFFLRPLATDMWPGLYLWGYSFSALAVAFMPLTLLAYERARATGVHRVVPPVLGLFCAWLQPWQGSTLLMLLVAAEALSWRRDRSPRPGLLLVTIVSTGLPLIYYALLSKVDPSWELVGEVNRLPVGPWWVVLLAVTPIGWVALLDLRNPTSTFGDRCLRLWPVMAIGLYWFIAFSGAGTFPLHAVQGLGIPLAVMAVRGVATVGLRWSQPVPVLLISALAVLYVVFPVGRELEEARGVGTPQAFIRAQPYVIEPGESAALGFLRGRDDGGGVLSRVYLGQAVPGLAGHRTWVGIASWTPDYDERVAQADELFSGAMTPAEARAFVRSTGARYVLQDCSSKVDLEVDLEPITASVHEAGCAAVIEVAAVR